MYILKNNPNWPEIADHTRRILMIRGFGSGKTNPLLNLINPQLDIDKIYLYAEDPSKAKYQYLSKKRESTSSNHWNYFKAFIEYLNNIDNN